LIDYYTHLVNDPTFNRESSFQHSFSYNSLISEASMVTSPEWV
jgi:hypothetical protein